MRVTLTTVAAMFLVSACTFDAGRTPSSQPVSGPGGGQEAIGAHERILQSYGGVYADEALASYVRDVIRKLARHEDLSSRTYSLTLLNSPLANAMALSDGRVYLTRGILALLNDEAELAAVLAHEMGHVSAGHIASRRNVASDIAALDNLVGDLVGWGGGTGLLSRSGLLAGYSRLQENDADRLAVTYLEAAGYDPMAVSDVLAVMNAYTNHRESQLDAALWAPSAGWLANHPDTQDRSRRTADLALALRRSSRPKRRGKDRYMAAVDGLLYGMPAERGFVRDSRFIHPVEGIRFQVPSGFRLFHGGDIVWALGPDKTIVKFDHVFVDGAVEPLTYLTDDWAGSLVLHGVRRFDLNGLSAASAWMRFQGLNTLAVAIMGRPGKVYRFLIGAPPQVGEQYHDDFQTLIASFELMDERDGELGPLRIRILKLGGSERMRDVAERLRLAGNSEAAFYLINGKRAGDTVPAGTVLKWLDDGASR